MAKLIYDEEGQTLVEYGLLVSLIAMVLISVLTLVGARLRTGFSVAANQIKTST